MPRQQQSFEEIQEALLELYKKQDFLALQQALNDLDTIDAAEFISDLPVDKAAAAFRLLPKTMGMELFVDLDHEAQRQLLMAMDDPQVVELLDTLYNDDLTDILDEMPAHVVKRLLQITPPERRSLINRLLRYPEGSAGAIMTTEYLHIDGDATIREAFELLRHCDDKLRVSYHLFVTSKDDKLEGIISVRDIFQASEDALVEDEMNPFVVSMHTYDDQEDVAKTFQRYDLLILPITDSEDRLVGIVTVDDVLDVLQEEASEDINRMAAVQPTTEHYLESSLTQQARRRLPWLFILMLSGFFNAKIVGSFEEGLTRLPILVSFIPMLTDTAGNSGSQSSAVIIQSIALGEISFKDLGKTILKEMLIGLCLGLTLAAVAFSKIYWLEGGSFQVALTVGLSLTAIAVLAQFLGAFLPLLASRIKIDPAVMAGPLIATLLDAIALIIYFLLADLIILSALGG